MAWSDKYSEELTVEEQNLFKEIERYARSNLGLMPTISNLKRFFEIKSTGNMHALVKSLEEKGVIELINAGGNKRRVIIKERRIKKTPKKYQRAKKLNSSITQIKTAIIPLLKDKVNDNTLLRANNFEEYISIPEEYFREENMFAFQNKTLYQDDKVIIEKDAIIIVDIEAKYLSRDFICRRSEINEIYLERYKRGDSKENILGKVIAKYSKITF